MTSKNRTRRVWATLAIIAVGVGLLLTIACHVLLTDDNVVLRDPKALEELTHRGAYYGALRETQFFKDTQTLKLCRAIKKGDLEKTRRLIAAGADVNAKGKNNVALLNWAFGAGEDVLECLLANGADPNVECKNEAFDNEPFSIVKGKYLLYAALQCKIAGDKYYDNYPSLLLKYGADPNLGDRNLLIMTASSERTRDDFYKLIAAGADVNPADCFPVVECLGIDDISIYLLEHGAIYDVNTPQGSALQRRVYELTETRDGRLAPMSPESRESIEKTRKWLEAHGVGFDKEAPQVNIEYGTQGN